MGWFMDCIRGSTGMKAMSPLVASLTLRPKEFMDLESMEELQVLGHPRAVEENSPHSMTKAPSRSVQPLLLTSV
mgnify:CR=1 FL=1